MYFVNKSISSKFELCFDSPYELILMVYTMYRNLIFSMHPGFENGGPKDGWIQFNGLLLSKQPIFRYRIFAMSR